MPPGAGVFCTAETVLPGDAERTVDTPVRLTADREEGVPSAAGRTARSKDGVPGDAVTATRVRTDGETFTLGEATLGSVPSEDSPGVSWTPETPARFPTGMVMESGTGETLPETGCWTWTWTTTSAKA